jgi:hypothetical protein
VVRVVEACGRRWKKAGVPGVAMGQDGYLRFPAGLVPSLVRELTGAGYHVEVYDQRSNALAPDITRLETVTGSARRYLEAVTHNPVGLVEVSGDTDLVTRLSQLVALYASVLVVVAVPTRAVAGQVWRALCSGSVRPFALVTSDAHWPGKPGGVITFSLVAQRILTEPSVLALVGAEHARTFLFECTTGASAYARVYAFVDVSRANNDDTALRLTALAGEVIHTVAATPLRGRVMMNPAPSAPVKPRGHGLARKRCR